MRQTYYIHGMSCQGCRSHVEGALADIPGVKKAAVDLEREEAEIEFDSRIPFEVLREHLESDGGRYSIFESRELMESILKTGG